jgi:ferritin-like metal-binding protein YciE
MINPLQVRNANFHFMELETLKDLYIHQLKDLQSAERQPVKALPQMAKTAINVAAAK